jgi:hypothetical protein
MKSSLMDKKIGVLVRREVITVMREMFSDPEAGLDLALEATRRIGRSCCGKTGNVGGESITMKDS